MKITISNILNLGCNIVQPLGVNSTYSTFKHTVGSRNIMASRFDFYSFSEYEFLISTIQFLPVTVLILDIRNSILTRHNGYF